MDSYRQVRNKVNTLNKQLKKQYYTNKDFCMQRQYEGIFGRQSMNFLIKDQSPVTLTVSLCVCAIILIRLPKLYLTIYIHNIHNIHIHVYKVN